MQAPTSLPFTSGEAEAPRVNDAPVVPPTPGFAQKGPHLYVSWHAVSQSVAMRCVEHARGTRTEGSLARPQGVPALQEPGSISPGTPSVACPVLSAGSVMHVPTCCGRVWLLV